MVHSTVLGLALPFPKSRQGKPYPTIDVNAIAIPHLTKLSHPA
jgi:hypothetical protein